MKIFASELSKCRTIKLIYGIFLGISAFIIFVLFPILWFFKAPVPKTGVDFVREYVVQRLNFTPDTVEKAYFNPLQATFPLYKSLVKEEIDFVKKNKIYQYAIILDINHNFDDKNKYLIYVHRVRFSCIFKNKCDKLLENKLEKLYVRAVEDGKFIIEEKSQ